MNIPRNFRQRVRDIVNDPNLDKPISNLNRDYQKTGTVKLITKIKPIYHE